MVSKGSNSWLRLALIFVVADLVSLALSDSSTIPPQNPEQILQELKQTRNTVIQEWEMPMVHSGQTHPSSEFPETGQGGTFSSTFPHEKKPKEPWQPLVSRREGETVAKKEVIESKEKKAVYHIDEEEKGVSSDGGGMHQGDGENYSTFALIVLAFLPAVAGIMVCGTLVVAVFTRASKPGSVEQRARQKMNQWGVFEGVGAGDMLPQEQQPVEGGMPPDSSRSQKGEKTTKQRDIVYERGLYYHGPSGADDVEFGLRGCSKPLSSHSLRKAPRNTRPRISGKGIVQYFRNSRNGSTRSASRKKLNRTKRSTITNK